MIMDALRRAPGLVLGVILFTVSLVTVWMLYRSELQLAHEQLESTLQLEAERDYMAVSERLLRYSKSAVSLTLSTLQNNAIISDETIDVARAEPVFRSSFADFPDLAQVRWLNKNGQEILRLDRVFVGEEPQVVVSQLLQDKSSRYYFKEAIGLEPGQIYASNLDLNIEFGKVVKPLEPTLRLAIPTRNLNEEVTGLLVLNFNLSDLLQSLAESKDSRLILEIVDESGHWKLHTLKPGLNWSDQLESPGHSIATEAPHLFAQLRAYQREGDNYLQQPFLRVQELPLNSLFSTQHQLFLLSSVDPAALKSLETDLFYRAFWVLGVMLFISGVFVVWLQRSENQRSELLKRLEEQLRHTESANAYKSRFLANLSHEIRTPITSMLGMLELLQISSLKPEQQQRLDYIAASAEDLREVVNELMDFNSIETGRITLHPRYLNLTESLEKSVELYSASAETKNLELLLEHDTELVNLDVYTDGFRLAQVLNNLLSNAIKYTPAGSVRLKVRILSRNDTEVRLLFEVIDTGVGLDQSSLAQLTLPFGQADMSLTQPMSGTGFGLAIVNYLLALFGSHLEAESVPKKGSSFSFSLQLPYKQTLRLAPLQDGKPSIHRVLIVDDQPLVAKNLSHMLDNWGIASQVAFDAMVALDMYRKAQSEGQPYELVLVDWKLPGGRGVDLLEQIKLSNDLLEEPDKAATLVILSTHSAQPEIEVNLPGLAGIRVLNKPITFTGLQQMMQDLGWLVVVSDKKRESREQIREKLISRLNEQLIYSKPPRILLVEDNKTNQLVVKELISSFGLGCDIAENGEQALLMTTGIKYDLVLMDIQMPVMDGLTATRELRLRYSHRELPIVALSAATLDDDVIAAEEAGVNAHLAKPLDVLKLLNVILQFWQPELKDLPQDHQVNVVSNSIDSAPALDEESARQLLQCSPDFALDNTVYQWLGFEAYQRVTEGFLQDVLPQLDYWQVAGGDQPSGRKRHFIHQLKSAAGNIGAFRLQALATQCDERLSRGEDVDITHLIDQLESICKILKPLVGQVQRPSQQS
ncbi:response regulator [Neptuniibacter sp. CAU 1671]|uniref:hybrid sensor histidine kinase/response regulator n=1 Tax=Neptuniibacter sp. CAU 1671 TaxID=3032593 RepID=UPI0023DC58DC|nr:response regulator [Neptuniibacter sp. CAU 1671]